MATMGISTNTRLLGLAIIKQGKLTEYSIRLFKASWSPSKVTQIIASLEPCVRQYCIKKVVLSIPHAYHQTKIYKDLVTALRKYFKEKSIPIYSENQKTIHRLCPASQKKTKKALMNELTTMYPQLTYCYQKELRNKSKYYVKLFEAVAVAHLHERME